MLDCYKVASEKTMSKEKYVSPIEDELELEVKTFRTDIHYHLNKKTKRVLLDVPIGVRRKISQSGTSMLLANGRLDLDELKGTVQMNLNVWDKSFSDAELPKVKAHLEIKQKQADLKQQLADLKA